MTSSILSDDIIARLPVSGATKTIWVAFSGGLDSHVLLYLLARNRPESPPEIAAIHVNHCLNPKSGDWAEHCRQICKELDIRFCPVQLDATAPRGESQEAWARVLRYKAIGEYLQEDDILLTAHHKDDLAETLLIQLFRGAGPAGLAAMPETTRFERGWHCRPLLGYTRDELHALAEAWGLAWIEDDSNRDFKFDRNYVRHNLMPLIKHRWPGVPETLARVARIQAETGMLLNDLAETDLASCLHEKGSTISVNALKKLTLPRAANVLRFWIRNQGHRPPAAAVLSRIFEDVLHAKAGAEPCVSWEDVQIRRYRDILFLTAPLPEPAPVESEIFWKPEDDCMLNVGRLSARRGKGNGIKLEKYPGRGFIVKFRRGSDVIKKNGHHHKLRKLFQEKGVPSCYRDYIPLIYIDDRLVEISGLHIDDDFLALPDEDALQIRWSGAAQVYALSDD